MNLIEKSMLAGFILIFLAMAAQPANAQSDEELAKTHFKAAGSYYNQGKYEKALEEFKEAYRLMPLPEVIYNMAQCYERLGDLETSIEEYRKYMEEKPDAKDLQAIRDKIESLKDRLDKTGVMVKISEESATVYVDGTEVASSPVSGLIKVSPGDHELKVEKEGFHPYTMKFSVAAGLSQSATINMTPIAEDKPDEGKAEIEPLPPVGKKKKGNMTGYWAAYAVSGALLLVGGVTGVMALVEVGKANDNTDDKVQYDEHERKANRYAIATDVLIPSGAVALVITSIVLGVKKPWKEKKKTATITPFVSGDGGGLMIDGRF
ncbi:MAG: tetratricopeptide repeat protein [Pseudomonadota bacterium]